MKKALIALMAVVGMLAQAAAYEIPENPDRKISIGLGYGRSSESGSFTINNLNFSDGQNLSTNSFGGDIKLPLSSFLTFSIGGSYLWSSTETNFKPFTDHQSSDLKGYSFNVGFRVYMP